MLTKLDVHFLHPTLTWLHQEVELLASELKPSQLQFSTSNLLKASHLSHQQQFGIQKGTALYYE
jgi:hypothetical protein